MADPLDPFAPAWVMCRHLAEGEVSSRELVDAHLRRIDRHDGRLGAFLTVDAEGALAAARRADDALAAGANPSPLHGLPISLKDCFATAGLRTTAGKVEMAGHVPEQDAVVVQRLRAAGAVVLGKTNLPAGVSGQESANELTGRTNNPWDLARTPGGSSGGAAASVAAGLSPLDIGSDSGGSIRQPSHCCGVYGHVATHGLVPQRGHLPSVPTDDVGAILDMFSIGPIARDPLDLVLLLDVLVGPDPLGPPAWSVALPPPSHGADHLTRARVAFLSGHPACPTSKAVSGAIERAAAELEAAGAEVRELEVPFDLEEAMDLAFRLWAASSAPDDDGRGGRGDHLSRARREAVEATHATWLELDARRREVTRGWAAALEELDVAILPISPVPALPHDPRPDAVDGVGHRLERSIDVDGQERPYLDQVLWNVLVGIAGLPATAVPLGLADGGLPVGAQVVALPHMDRATIAFAGAMAKTCGGFIPPPGC